MSQNGNRHREQIKPLTGLRFAAAFLVLLHHLPCLKGKVGLPLGAIGVGFFFVLSGFILTYVYAGRIQSWHHTRKFWFARLARIWPVHLFTLLVYIVCIMGPFGVVKDANRVVQFFMNVFLLHSWIPDFSWVFQFNGVSWSISTEFFFYAAFPFLILLRPKRMILCWLTLLGCSLLAVAVGSVFLYSIENVESASVWQGRALAAIQLNPLMRLAEFSAGIVVGHRFLSRNGSGNVSRSRVADSVIEIVVLGLVVAYVFCWSQILRWTFSQPELRLLGGWIKVSCVSLVFMSAIYVFATRRGIVSWLLSRRPIVYLGEVSFSLYMIHQIVFGTLRRNFAGFWESGFWFCAPVAILISIGLSIVMFELLEMPARSALMKFRDRQWKSGLGQLRNSWRMFGTSRLIATILCVVMLSIMATRTTGDIGIDRQRFANDRILPVMSNSFLKSGSILFADDAVLCGASYEALPDQSVVVHLVWEKRKETSRHRFMHVVGSNGHVVRNHICAPQRVLFQSAPLNRRFVETIKLESHHLDSGVKLGVGLFSRENRAAEVKGVPTSMHQHRLDLIRIHRGADGTINFEPYDIKPLLQSDI